MLQTAQRNNALAQLLIGNPDPVPKKAPADAAGLTSAEIAHRDLLAKERAESILGLVFRNMAFTSKRIRDPQDVCVVYIPDRLQSVLIE